MAELLDRISSAELAAWRVFDARIEPIGDRRRDLQAGSISATVANVYRDDKRRQTPYGPEELALDFTPQVEPTYDDRVQSNLAKLQTFAAMFGPAVKVVRSGDE